MYKFLICQTDEEKDVWFFSFNSRMNPKFSPTVKVAARLGYWSRPQNKWITSSIAVQLRSDYKDVKRAMLDSELTLIMLGLNVAEMKNTNYAPYVGRDNFDPIYFNDVVEL